MSMEHCRVLRAGIDVFIELTVSARGKWLCSSIHITLQCAQNFDLHSKHRNVVKRDEELWYEMLVMHTSLDSVHLAHVPALTLSILLVSITQLRSSRYVVPRISGGCVPVAARCRCCCVAR